MARDLETNLTGSDVDLRFGLEETSDSLAKFCVACA
jgi:hypothetical protein